MKGNKAGSIFCFLALLTIIRTQDVDNSPDLLKDAVPEEAVGQTNIRRSGEPSDDDAEANANDDASPKNGLDPRRSGVSAAYAQAHAEASSGGDNEYPYYLGSLNPISPYGTGSSSASAQAQALSGGESPGQGFNKYSPNLYPASPYDSVSNTALAKAIAEASSVGGSPNGQVVGSGLSPYSQGSLYPSPYSSGSSSAQAQAVALSGDARLNSLSPYSSAAPSDSGSSLTSAQAVAEVLSGGPGSQRSNSGLNPYLPNFLNPSGSEINSASAQALAESSNGGISYGQGSNSGLNPYSPETLHPISPYDAGSSLASAQALADVSNGGSPRGPIYAGLNPYLPGSLYPVPPSESSSAQAQAEAISGGDSNRHGQNSGFSPFLPGYPNTNSPYDSGSSSALAQTQAEVSSGARSPYLPGSSLVSSSAPSSGSNAYAQANAETTSGVQSHAKAIAKALITGNLNYRPIQQNEYVLPNSVPGAENAAVCTRVGELHYIWTDVECFVCACVINYESRLSPVCASCSGCLNPDPNPPAPTPPPTVPTISTPLPPSPVPLVTTTSPSPPPQVACRPLPSGVPFQNPLHPCQICICTETISVFGQPDVQIECQENPQCVVPPDVTTLPPLPDNKPKPLPLCKKFPQNVFFPYPADPCKLCKCSVSLSEYGIPEEQITCYPNPACDPQPIPIPSSTANPVTEPHHSTTSPPYPVTTAAPPFPGPLPGPSPHESCHPYQPNQPFQHPWDECQLCLCTESYSIGHITIEVNCYNKKSCCLVDTDPVTLPPLPYGSAESQASAIAQFNSNLILPGNLQPSNVLPGGEPQNQASAEAIAISQSNQPEYVLGPQGNQIRPGGLVPVPLGHRHIPGDNHLDDILGSQGYRPAGGQSIAEAIASAQSQVNQPSSDSGQSGYIIGSQGHLHRPGDNHPEHGIMSQGNQLRPGVGQSLAEAIALGQVNQGLQPSQILDQYGNQIRPGSNQIGNQIRPGGQVVPQIRPGGGQSGQYKIPGISAVEAEALANSQAGYNTNAPSYYQGYNLLGYNSPGYYGNGYYNYPPYYTGYSGNRGSPGYRPGGSSAEAVANANGDSSSANAEALASSQGLSQADASANAQSGLSSGNNLVYTPKGNAGYNSAGIPASLLYPDLYSRPSYEITPLYQPGRGFGGSSNAQALAQVQGGSSSQAQASVVSGGRTKSGNPEDEPQNEQDEKRR